MSGIRSHRTARGPSADLDEAGVCSWQRRAQLLYEIMGDHMKNDVPSLQESIINHVEYTLARSRYRFDDFEAYQATSLSVRDRLIESWNDTQVSLSCCCLAVSQSSAGLYSDAFDADRTNRIRVGDELTRPVPLIRYE
jgi:hypothetical protein